MCHHLSPEEDLLLPPCAVAAQHLHETGCGEPERKLGYRLSAPDPQQSQAQKPE
jgi:hypothetical protein